MITLVAAGVGSAELAANLSSMPHCYSLQGQGAQSPGEKPQTQLMIIQRGGRGPGDSPGSTAASHRVSHSTA